MKRMTKYFWISACTVVVPFCIYLLLYWYPSINYFSYVDNTFLSVLWGINWQKGFAFFSAPLSWLLLALMRREYSKGSKNGRDSAVLIYQLFISLTFLTYWVIILRIMFLL